ncbi:MAG: hypothetical protein IKH75_12815 [Ruminococcus sp.]|nr:hypothetical protein [Ruminococcus sp.]
MYTHSARSCSSPSVDIIISRKYAPDKSSGHRTQQIDIYYRFDVAVSTAVADSMKYDKKRKAA